MIQNHQWICRSTIGYDKLSTNTNLLIITKFEILDKNTSIDFEDKYRVSPKFL